MFFLGFNYNEDKSEEDLDDYSADKPTVDELSWVMNYVGHIVNQETLSKFFTDKYAAKNFSKLLHVGVLEKEMARLQSFGKGAAGNMDMEFIPQRNILTELSGHIADACWAEKYDSIVKDFPNFTSLTMVQNPGKQSERLAGAGMLIETESIDGEQLLIIRGLNPQENVINQLDVNDFYQNLISYLNKIARKGERKLAIVIDENSGGASSNRPVLFDYLKKLKSQLEKVNLKSYEDTTFNGYDIMDYCYFVE